MTAQKSCKLAFTLSLKNAHFMSKIVNCNMVWIAFNLYVVRLMQKY